MEISSSGPIATNPTVVKTAPRTAPGRRTVRRAMQDGRSRNGEAHQGKNTTVRTGPSHCRPRAKYRMQMLSASGHTAWKSSAHPRSF